MMGCNYVYVVINKYLFSSVMRSSVHTIPFAFMYIYIVYSTRYIVPGCHHDVTR